MHGWIWIQSSWKKSHSDPIKTGSGSVQIKNCTNLSFQYLMIEKYMYRNRIYRGFKCSIALPSCHCDFFCVFFSGSAIVQYPLYIEIHTLFPIFGQWMLKNAKFEREFGSGCTGSETGPVFCRDHFVDTYQFDMIIMVICEHGTPGCIYSILYYNPWWHLHVMVA